MSHYTRRFKLPAFSPEYSFSRFFTTACQQSLLLLSVLICTAPFVIFSAIANDSIAEPDGYRLEQYDAPVPEKLTGSTTVDAFAVKELLEQKALVIDVIPQHRRPEFLPENQIWIPVDHQGVAGSIWLPDIGYGVLSEITIDYFKDNLARHTAHQPGFPIVFYCRLDCWMSWNAAKRALEFGYTNVYWFADGIDGWTFEDFETATLTPEPGIRQ